MGLLARNVGSFPAAVRNELFRPFEVEFDRFFNDFFHDSSRLDKIKAAGGYPKLDVFEDGLDEANTYFVINASVPGVAKEDLKVEIIPTESSVSALPKVRISGEMQTEYRPKDENSHFYVRELCKSKFSREISLPKNIEGDPEAKLKDGILTLYWRLKSNNPPVVQPKLISIN